MKEKIIKILESQFSVVEYEDPDTGFTESTTIDVLTTDEFPDIVNKLEILVNQEVEKRIAERMDEMEAGFLERWIRAFNLYSDTSAFCNGYRRMREERDLLVSQKTDNLKENNNNGSRN